MIYAGQASEHVSITNELASLWTPILICATCALQLVKYKRYAKHSMQHCMYALFVVQMTSS